MRLANQVAAAAAVLIGVSYAAWMSYLQWDWYLGWPHMSFAQGILECGWPTTFLCHSAASDAWRCSIRNLCINTGFCLLLSVTLAIVIFRISRSLADSCGRPKFSLATLFLVMIAVGLTFPLWKLPGLVSLLGINRWSFSIAEWEIPRALSVLVTVGLFCIGFCVAEAAVLLFGGVCRWRRARSERAAFSVAAR